MTDHAASRDVTLEALAEEIAKLKAGDDSLRAENVRLSQRLAQIEGGVRPVADDGPAKVGAAMPTVETHRSAQPETDHPVSRRGAMKALGAAAAGGIGLAAGSAFLAAEPAAASNNNPVLLGESNTATASTTVTTSSGIGLAGVAGAVAGDLPFVPTGVFGSSTTGVGVWGSSSVDGSAGVRGIDSSDTGGIGVDAQTSTGNAVYGLVGGGAVILPDEKLVGVFGDSATGLGVLGTSAGSDGVQGQTTATGASAVSAYDTSGSAGGKGVNASSTAGYGVQASGGRAPLRLNPAAGFGPPTTGSHQPGEVYTDSEGAIFLCTGAGTPGTWNQLTASAPHYNNNGGITGSLGHAGSVNLLSAPIRVFDTRVADPPAAPSRPKGQVLAGSTTPLQITGVTVGGLLVPAGAVAVVGNVTAAVPAAIGYLTLYPAGETAPATSNLNYSAGVNVANYCVVVLNGSGQMDIFSQSQTDVIFDVTGFVY
jgi:hypothetical protein